MEMFILALLGLCFGSFINALVWRIRHKRDMLRERSECTHCHHILAWYDLIPVLSWLSLGGKCRYCRKPIDDSPIVEVVTGLLFVISYLVWPYGMTNWGLLLFGLWLVALVLMIALTVYDLKWYLLPNAMVYPLIALGVVIGYIRFAVIEGLGLGTTAMSMLGGVLVIAGLYWLLHQISAGKWVGFGDVRLSVFIGLILGWQGALLALFAANVIGCLIVLPGLLMKKLSPKSKIPFGPFLISACIVAFLWGKPVIDWYVKSVIGL